MIKDHLSVPLRAIVLENIIQLDHRCRVSTIRSYEVISSYPDFQANPRPSEIGVEPLNGKRFSNEQGERARGAPGSEASFDERLRYIDRARVERALRCCHARGRQIGRFASRCLFVAAKHTERLTEKKLSDFSRL